MKLAIPERARRAMLIGAILTVGAAFACVSAAWPATLSLAPPNPALIRYAQESAVARLQAESTGGHPPGLVPTPIKLPQGSARKALFRTNGVGEGLPSSYDMRTQAPEKLPPVRHQGGCGSCWAFASYGSLESCLRPAQVFDFSENNLKNLHGFDLGCCDGGNHWMSAAYLARWSGPIAEVSDPYNAGSCYSPTGLPVLAHVQRVDFLPDRAGSLDNDTIKQAVMDRGPVYTTFYVTESSSYYSSANKAYYYNGSADTNHAVCIVGWDDDFNATKFPKTPPGDGAFIVRNSWGSSWGEGGYFYLSYYDVRIGVDNAVFPEIEPTTNYNQLYHYDPYGWVESVGYDGTSAWCANVFTAVGTADLKAVSFYAATPQSAYEVYVYLQPDSGPIASSGPVASKTGTMANAGYQTVVLDSPVPLQTGQRFSVVVRLTTPGYNYPIPIETSLANYTTSPTANAGESYMSSDGVEWTDLTADYPDANVCIKAFATASSGLSVSPPTGLECEGPIGGPFTPASVAYTLTNHGTASLEWTAGATSQWVSLSSTGGTLAGGASMTVTVSINAAALGPEPGGYLDTVTITNVTNSASTTRGVSLFLFANYEAREAPFGWVDPPDCAPLTLGDDKVSTAQPLPFVFGFYDKSYTNFYVGDNGLAGFAADGLDTFLFTSIPAASVPNNAIYAYWDDLDPTAGGTICWGVAGVEPNRKLAISWIGVPPYGHNGAPLTFQAVLCEGSDDILLHYANVQPGDAEKGAGREATTGVENDSGLAAFRYSYRGSPLLHNGQAVLLSSRGQFPAEIKRQPDQALVATRRAIVTRVFGDAFYIESDNRMCGIRVQKTGHGLLPGMRASVSGTLATNSDEERFIDAAVVTPTGLGSVTPLGLTSSAIGGGACSYDPSTGAGQAGLKALRAAGEAWQQVDLTGANNVGLLVRTCGRVTWTGADEFYVDDGSAVRDASLKPGLRVRAQGLEIPSARSFVTITGVVSCYKSDGVVYRVLLVGQQDDIVPVE